MTNSGGPPIAGRDHGALHRHRLERRLAEGLDQRRLAEDVAGRDPVAGPRTAAPDRRGSRPGLPLELWRAAGPSPTKASRPRPSEANASASRTTFLRSISEPTQRKAGPSPSQPSSRRASSAGRGRERVEVDAADRRPRSSARPPGSGSVSRSASQRELAITAEERPRTQRVAAVTPGIRPRLATSWPWAMTTSGRARRARGERPGRPGGEEEVGEDDVGPEASARRLGPLRTRRQVLRRGAAAAADRGDLDLVAERLDLPRQRHQEAAEVRAAPGWATSG